MDLQKESEEKAVALRAQVDALQVVDQASYDLAGRVNFEARERKAAFHGWFDPIDDASKKQRQAVIAQGKLVDDPLDYVIKTTGSKRANWYAEEQARIAEEKRKAEETARLAAEEERIRAAEVLQKEGMTAAAEEVLEQPIVIPKIVMDGPAKANGDSYRKTYSAEVTSLMLLIKAVAAGEAPIAYLEANMVALNSWARATKGTEAMPGVKVVSKVGEARR